MNIQVDISQDDYDCVNGELTGTVEDWLQAAIDGKVNNCMKRSDPVAAAEMENSLLKARIVELENMG